MKVLAALFALCPLLAEAQALTLPSRAALAAEEQEADGQFPIAVAPARDGVVVSQPARGAMTRRAFRVESPGVTTGQLLEPLRDQIEAAGFQVLFSCEAARCGGFDFRFGLDGFRAPELFVDLGDYRYLSARKGGAPGPSYVALLVSRSEDAGYIEITQVAPVGAAVAEISATGATPRLALSGDLAKQLNLVGRAILHDLEFQTGSSDLADGPSQTLEDLADYLRSYPDREVALVGHTDSEGSLEGNIALSKRRAGSVRARLLERFDIPGAQVRAEGMGYLSPVASNLTPQGREANRRVEVIVTSLE